MAASSWNPANRGYLSFQLAVTCQSDNDIKNTRRLSNFAKHGRNGGKTALQVSAQSHRGIILQKMGEDLVCSFIRGYSLLLILAIKAASLFVVSQL